MEKIPAHYDAEAFASFLAQYQERELLRFVAVGSVDDGKSTLIGRLLHDTAGVYEDQLEAIKNRKGSRAPGEIDFSLLTDGLKAEREQGITIDVAYRYFTTEKRKFIIADTPGHVQYTRNMVTGASTADLGIILIDARYGVLPQTRRHAFIASLLGLPRLLVAVNKMDLVAYDQAVFDRIVADFSAFAAGLRFVETRPIPISAVYGDNVVSHTDAMPWYDGPTILSYLEDCPLVDRRGTDAFRFPVQTVLRPHLDYRGFAGQIVNGEVKVGDELMALPSRLTSRVKAIDLMHESIATAGAPASVCIRLEDEIDISRGDMLVSPDAPAEVTRTLDAWIVWLAEKPMDPGKTYLLKHTTQTVQVNCTGLFGRVNLESLRSEEAETFALNDIGRARFVTHRPLYVDPYTECRSTGAFILIDSLSNLTVGAGMIDRFEDADEASFDNVDTLRPVSQISRRERTERFAQTGGVLLFTGLPASGKSALARALERRLFDLGHFAVVLDPEDRAHAGQNPLMLASLAHTLAASGLIVLVPDVMPTEAERSAMRARLGAETATRLISVTTSEDICRARDFRGVYADTDHTPSAFEAVGEADWSISLDKTSPMEAADTALRWLRDEGWLLRR